MESIYPEEVTIFAAVVLYGVPVAVAVLSYLLGCINGAIATSHLFYHDDVRRHGSGNNDCGQHIPYPPLWLVALL